MNLLVSENCTIFSVIHQDKAVARLLLELRIALAGASLSSMKHKLIQFKECCVAAWRVEEYQLMVHSPDS